MLPKGHPDSSGNLSITDGYTTLGAEDTDNFGFLHTNVTPTLSINLSGVIADFYSMLAREK